MPDPPVRHRRVRRTDFVAVVAILAASGLPVPPPDRSALRRFRRLVADLGVDFYLAVDGVRPVGFVHVTYARQIATPMRGRVEALVVAPEARRAGVGSSLARLARERARRRGCDDLRCRPDDASPAARTFLARNGWRADGEEFRVEFTTPAK